ncbi:uncharacterized protein LOC109813523 [Cajanus cajan]|uniref:Uncharacterized protein n=1 Tax=Cajanus cajan TaxID=3821 RepID=A0A151S373_CAJCA|nr:uncharacterized protein LOC109813523 [Cajanus cajan]KYP49285.1 hypothetical protein KK1_029026 [Cajanus cajan]
MKLEGVIGGCKDHPNNKQVPGVCPYCLRDKLSRLNNNNNYNPTYPLPSPPSPQPQLFPSYVSRHHHHYRRHSSIAMDSVSSMTTFNHELKKSKSIAFDREVNGSNRGRKKTSVWSKLFKLTRKNTKEAFICVQGQQGREIWHS